MRQTGCGGRDWVASRPSWKGASTSGTGAFCFFCQNTLLQVGSWQWKLLKKELSPLSGSPTCKRKAQTVHPALTGLSFPVVLGGQASGPQCGCLLPPRGRLERCRRKAVCVQPCWNGTHVDCATAFSLVKGSGAFCTLEL